MHNADLTNLRDPVLSATYQECHESITQRPFSFDSLLSDRDEHELTYLEKENAMKFQKIDVPPANHLADQENIDMKLRQCFPSTVLVQTTSDIISANPAMLPTADNSTIDSIPNNLELNVSSNLTEQLNSTPSPLFDESSPTSNYFHDPYEIIDNYLMIEEVLYR